MDKLKMRTKNLTDENFAKLAALFPNAVTETINENGEVVRAIDADVLRQEISAEVVKGTKERYQFTWPDKKKSVVLANAPIAKTLRIDREKSVGRDGKEGSVDTENIYIEGDNLDALKLLQETYLGKVKMIYIDPPYNTGSDAFVYDDDFKETEENFKENSGAIDEDGNRLFDMRVNNESNGRFHTDWLNMIYPRLRLAKDLLSDDGVIFISIDDNEQENLKKICDEVFGARNFVAQFLWKAKLGKVGTNSLISSTCEYITCYAKDIANVSFKMIEKKNESRKENLRQWGQADRREDRPSMYYPIIINGIEVYPIKEDGSEGRWRVGKEKAEELLKNGELELICKNGFNQIYRNFPSGMSITPYETLIQDIGTTASGTQTLKDIGMARTFDYSKPKELIRHFCFLSTKYNKNALILDFFSGSATTAHAVMQLNAEDNGKRKFIMVQLPEPTADKSEAKKAGYNNICEIGEERIRRAAKKIKEETGADIDYGFRVFKVDSSNMKDVYYRPQDLNQEEMELFADNIKEDRAPEDLLIQVMLDLGVLLSSKIEEKEICGKKIFSVDDGYLIACFDENITEEIVTEIAKKKPFYAVFRDSSMENDAVITNFEQIFETHSPQTVRKVL
ncbi:MAG: site-specific DNA-methyltransferase [Selenomonadaceae bacterium]|nr:site-specific DNA-methyltransferase [Selenomonadaceae bacterium]